MKRSELKRKKPMDRGTSKLKSTKKLARESPKRRSEKAERAAMRLRVIERDKGCVGRRRGLPRPCGALPGRPGWEVHEFKQRSTHPGSHLRDEDAVTMCPVHHEMCTSPSGEMRVLVEKLGLIERATS